MKRIIAVAGALLLTFGQITAVAAATNTAIRTIGSGDKTEIDPASLPPQLREGYELMRRSCLSCHGESRTLDPIRHCREKNHNEEYCVRDIRVAIMRNLRRPGVDLSREEGKKLIDFFIQLRELRLQ